MRIRIVSSLIVALLAMTLMAGLISPTAVQAEPPCPPGEVCPPIPEPPPAAPITSPADFRITGKTDTSISFSWRDSTTNENSFKIYRRGPGRHSARVFHVVSFDSHSTGRLYSRTDEALSVRLYCYRIQAANDHGESFLTEELCARVPPPPAAPTGLEITGVEKRSISLSWRDNSTDEKGFVLERRQPNGEEWKAINQVIRTRRPGSTYVPSTSIGQLFRFTDKRVRPGTRYCYRVRAWNSGGSSSSEERCASTLPDVPAAPSNLYVSYRAERALHLTWRDNSNNEEGFNMYYRQPPDGTWQLCVSSECPHEVLGLSPDTEYCFRVTAYNTDGESPASNEACGRTRVAPPQAPSNFTAIEVTATTVTLRWQDNASDENSYSLDRRRVGASTAWMGVDNWGPLDGWFTYTDSKGLSPDTEYEYKLQVYKYGAPNSSATLVVKTNPSGSGSKPDLAFYDSLVLTPVFPDPYEPFTIKWKACNFGGTSTGSFKDVAQLDGGATYERSVSSIPSGSCYEKAVWLPGLPPGDHYWYVYLDAYNDVDESNEGNNVNYYGFILD